MEDFTNGSGKPPVQDDLKVFVFRSFTKLKPARTELVLSFFLLFYVNLYSVFLLIFKAVAVPAASPFGTAPVLFLVFLFSYLAFFTAVSMLRTVTKSRIDLETEKAEKSGFEEYRNPANGFLKASGILEAISFVTFLLVLLLMTL